MITKELEAAISVVCMACPYICDCSDSELYELAGCPDAGEKYCERCMVTKMVALYEAEDPLSYDSPEWQDIINY